MKTEKTRQQTDDPTTVEVFGDPDPACPDCDGTGWAHNAWLDRLSVCHCARYYKEATP